MNESYTTNIAAAIVAAIVEVLLGNWLAYFLKQKKIIASIFLTIVMLLVVGIAVWWGNPSKDSAAGNNSITSIAGVNVSSKEDESISTDITEPYTPIAVSDTRNSDENESDRIRIVAEKQKAFPGKKGVYTIFIENNPGFATAEIGILYDERMDIKYDSNKKKYGFLNALSELSCSFSVNQSRKIIGIGLSGLENTYENGALFSFEYQIPEDAVPGDTYDIKIDVDILLDENLEKVSYETFDGWIEVQTSP